MSAGTTVTTPNMAEIRKALEDLFPRSAFIYWTDMLLSAAVGWGALASAATRPDGFDLVTALLVVVAAVAFLRAALFIHEISHFRRGVLPGFTVVWNLIVGVPMLLPSFMYVGTHTDHHKRHLYGTIGDPEYLPLASMGRGAVVLFLLEMPLVPLLLLVRYGILSPLSWVIPPLRKPVVERLSALVVNPAYRREAPKGRARLGWITMEVLLCASIWTTAWLIIQGVWPARVLYVWYATATVVALINQFRTLTAHHYENDGRELSVMEQLLDSVNVEGRPLITEMVYPVGLRFHGLHHWLADMPYHSLPAAHRRLLEFLPPDHPYRDINFRHSWPVVARLWRRAMGHHGYPPAWRRPS
ncbi:MAG TPA: fatty acid desaturase [Planctomycetes bacterium]|nr:fatty acid desaturase [Planctomycetota bacterium]